MTAGFRLEPAQPQAPVAGAPFHEWRFPDGSLWTQFYRLDGGYLLRFPELAEGVWMTNSPLAEKPIQRSQAFLPIGEAVPVREGELVRMAVMARPAEHVIAWSVEFPAAGRRFGHSTWQGMLLSPEELLRANPEHVPRASREGRARMTVLGYCDGRRSAREIEQAVLRDHPDLFPTADETARFVAQVLGRDTE